MKPLDWAPIIRATIASLKEQLPERIRIYNEEAANQYELEVPVAEAYYFGGDDLHPTHPCVEIAVPTAALGSFSLEQVGAAASSELAVSVWVEGVTGEIDELHERVLGYGLVAAEVLMQPDAFGGAIECVGIRATYPMIPQGDFNAETRSFDKWRSCVVLEIDLAADARRPL